MGIFYLDTSAIVKRYRNETGTDLVDKLLDSPHPQHRFYTSFLSVLEMTSALLRLAKGGQIDQDTAKETLARFHRDLRQNFRVWPLDDNAVRLLYLYHNSSPWRSV